MEQVFHMNGGLGETSYAKNSSQQRVVISKVKPILEETIKKVYSETLPEWIRIADLGCSSGPNTLTVVSIILDAIDVIYRRLNSNDNNKKSKPVFEVFLNDLPGNDFNTLFRSLIPIFFERLKREKGDDFGPCFVSGLPGNFYGRLFPNNSMHFIHSSYSLHWLPKAPNGLVSKKGEPMNKENIYITSKSPREVFKAYLDEFQESFTLFLRRRSEEIIPGCALLLTIIGRFDDPNSVMEVLGKALNQMVLEGLMDEEKVEHFNLAYYTPTISEVKKVIKEEGSFSLHKLDSFTTNWDVGFKIDNIKKEETTECYNNDDEDKIEHERAQYVSDHIRAILEPILSAEFGEPIMDSLFQRFTDKVAHSMENEKWAYLNLVISLTKKRV